MESVSRADSPKRFRTIDSSSTAEKSARRLRRQAVRPGSAASVSFASSLRLARSGSARTGSTPVVSRRLDGFFNADNTPVTRAHASNIKNTGAHRLFTNKTPTNTKSDSSAWRTPSVMHAGASRHWQDMEDLSPDSRQLFEDIEEAQRDENVGDDSMKFVSRVFPPTTNKQEHRCRVSRPARDTTATDADTAYSLTENAAAVNNNISSMGVPLSIRMSDLDYSSRHHNRVQGDVFQFGFSEADASVAAHTTPSMSSTTSAGATPPSYDCIPKPVGVPIVKRTLHYMNSHSRDSPHEAQQQRSGQEGQGREGRAHTPFSTERVRHHAPRMQRLLRKSKVVAAERAAATTAALVAAHEAVAAAFNDDISYASGDGIWHGAPRSNESEAEDDDDDDCDDEVTIPNDNGDLDAQLDFTTTPASFDSTPYTPLATGRQQQGNSGLGMREAPISCLSSSTSGSVDLTMSPMRLCLSSSIRRPTHDGNSGGGGGPSSELGGSSSQRTPDNRRGARTTRSRRNLALALGRMSPELPRTSTYVATAAAADTTATPPPQPPLVLDTAFAYADSLRHALQTSPSGTIATADLFSQQQQQQQQQHRSGATPRMGQCSISNSAPSSATSASEPGPGGLESTPTPRFSFFNSNLDLTPDNTSAGYRAVSPPPAPFALREQASIQSIRESSEHTDQAHTGDDSVHVPHVHASETTQAVSVFDAISDNQTSTAAIEEQIQGSSGEGASTAAGAVTASADDMMDESERLCRQLMMEEEAALMERIHQEQVLIIQQMRSNEQAANGGAADVIANDLNIALELATQQQHEADAANAAGAVAAGAGGEDADSGEFDPDTMSYDQLLELGDRIGDVGQERWRVEGKQAVAALPVVRFSSDRIVFAAALRAKEAEAAGGAGSAGLLTIDFVSDDPKCLICQYAYAEDDMVKMMPCSHGFHEECVDGWLKDYKTCVLCRQSIVE